MREHWDGEARDVVGYHVVTAFEDRVGLGRVQERE